MKQGFPCCHDPKIRHHIPSSKSNSSHNNLGLKRFTPKAKTLLNFRQQGFSEEVLRCLEAAESYTYVIRCLVQSFFPHGF